MMAKRCAGAWCGRYVALWAMAWLAGGAAQADSTQEEELPAEIVKAITQREARTRTIRLEWVENMIVKKGAYRAVEGLVPERDLLLPQNCLLLLDGDRALFRKQGIEWHIQRLHFLMANHVFTLNGTELKNLLDYEPAEGFPIPDHIAARSVPLPFVRGEYDHKADRFLPTGSVTLPLLMYCYRFTSPRYCSLPLDKFVLARQRTIVKGVDCKVLELRSKRGEPVLQVAVDEAHQYRVLRHDWLWHGRVTQRFECQYSAEDPHRLESWSLTEYARSADQSPLVATTVSSPQLTINGRIAAREFEYRFPPATIVQYDRYNSLLLARKDGTLRPYLPEENKDGKTLEELAESPPVEGLRTIETLSGKSTWGAGTLAVVVLAVAVFAAVVVLRRWHKR
jgi:hypothetical protein